jgi:hypothetical protein
MERMGPRRAGDENGDGTTAGRAGAVRAAAVTVAVVAALAGCSVTVKPKNAAASRPLTSSSPTPSAVASSTAPSTSAAPSSSASPTPTPSDIDHTVCTNVRDVLATLKSKLTTDKDSDSRSAQDYRTAGTALRVQDTKTDNSDLKATLKAVGTAYQTVGHDVANQVSAVDDLAKAAEASKPLSTMCGGGSGPSSGTGTSTSGSSN